MLRFHSKIFVPASFTFLSLGNFSRISKKNLVPKLLKDGKFTRTGISKTKNKSYQYDLSQPHIINPHLYYDEKNDKIKKRHEYKARKAITNEYPPVSKDTETEHLINNLNDDYLLKKPSGRIMSVILELEKRDTNIIEEYIDPIKTALEKLSRKVFYFNLREFGILVTLSARYIPDNENTWKQYTLNFLRILEKKKYYQENPIESKNREKNLIFIFNNIYKSSLRHNFDIKQIVTDMKDLMMDKIDSLSSLSHTILFLTTLTKNSDNPKQDGKNYLIKLIPKINEQIKNINEKDSIGLIQTMHKCEVSDLTLLKNLGENL